MSIARESGQRSKVAVQSMDSTIDSVTVCVGVRGNRIKNIVDSLAGEPIDLVRWHDDSEVFIRNALQPAEIEAVILDESQRRATVFVRANQLSLVAGSRGINQRLAGALCGYEIVVETT